MEEEQPLSLFSLNVDEKSTGTLRAASQWGRILAVLNFILGVLVILLGVIIYNKMIGTGSSGYAARSIRAIAIRYLAISILFGAMFITGGMLILNFSIKTATALDTSDQFAFNTGLSAIKSSIIFWTIIFMVLIVLILLAFIGLATL